MSLQDRLDTMIERYKNIEKSLNDGFSGEEYIKLSKEYSELSIIVSLIEAKNKISQELLDIEEILNDKNSDITQKDFLEMKEMAQIEKEELKIKLENTDKQIRLELLPKDKDDERNVIIEIRAGTGGDEASLFAANIMGMYIHYAALRKWKVEIMSLSENEIGGCREVSMLIAGTDAFRRLKFESGVHRVQRVPETESQGRIHTSAATVAVLPEAEEIDVQIDPKDLRIDIFRASGPGGQSVNTTDSAVRIVHLPTGITVQQQDERSQHKNKEKAMKILYSTLYEKNKREADSRMAGDRKSQVGSGDRSERIRTYNYPQNRITDHRIGLTIYKLDTMISEGNIDSIIDALISDDMSKRLAGIVSDL